MRSVEIVIDRVAGEKGRRVFSKSSDRKEVNRVTVMKTTLTIIGTMLAVGFAGLCGETAEAAKRQGGDYPALVAASEIKGTKVHNLQNQEIGYVDEVLIEPSAGQVRFVVLNVGGFLGIGGTKVAVPWTAFQLSREGYIPNGSSAPIGTAPAALGKSGVSRIVNFHRSPRCKRTRLTRPERKSEELVD